VIAFVVSRAAGLLPGGYKKGFMAKGEKDTEPLVDLFRIDAPPRKRAIGDEDTPEFVRRYASLSSEYAELRALHRAAEHAKRDEIELMKPRLVEYLRTHRGEVLVPHGVEDTYGPAGRIRVTTTKRHESLTRARRVELQKEYYLLEIHGISDRDAGIVADRCVRYVEEKRRVTSVRETVSRTRKTKRAPRDDRVVDLMECRPPAKRRRLGAE
jgi:hypothetical protein